MACYHPLRGAYTNILTDSGKRKVKVFPSEVQELFNYDSNLFIQSFLDGSLDSALDSLRNPDLKSDTDLDPGSDKKVGDE